MKTSMLKQLAGAFFALVLGTTSGFSQRGSCRYPVNNRANQGLFLNQIDNLTEKQLADIDELRLKHKAVMADLYGKTIRETYPDKRLAIRIEQLESIRNQRKAIIGILTPEQQKQMDINLQNFNQNRRSYFQGPGNRQGFRNNIAPGRCRYFQGRNYPGQGYGNRYGFGRSR